MGQKLGSQWTWPFHNSGKSDYGTASEPSTPPDQSSSMTDDQDELDTSHLSRTPSQSSSEVDLSRTAPDQSSSVTDDQDKLYESRLSRRPSQPSFVDDLLPTAPGSPAPSEKDTTNILSRRSRRSQSAPELQVLSFTTRSQDGPPLQSDDVLPTPLDTELPQAAPETTTQGFDTRTDPSLGTTGHGLQPAESSLTPLDTELPQAAPETSTHDIDTPANPSLETIPHETQPLPASHGGVINHAQGCPAGEPDGLNPTAKPFTPRSSLEPQPQAVPTSGRPSHTHAPPCRDTDVPNENRRLKISGIRVNTVFDFINELRHIPGSRFVQYNTMGETNITQQFFRIWVDFDSTSDMSQVEHVIRGLRRFGPIHVQPWEPHVQSERSPKTADVYRILLSRIPPCHRGEHAFACIYTNDGEARWFKAHGNERFEPGRLTLGRRTVKMLRDMERKSPSQPIAVPGVELSSLVLIGRRMNPGLNHWWQGY